MKRKFKAFIPIVLICTMLTGNLCYAASFDTSVDDSLTTVFDSVADALSGWLAADFGIVIPSSAFYARALSTYDITFPDAEEDFDDYVEDNTSIEDGNLIVNIDLSNFLVDVANKYIADNPTSYSIQKVYSYTNASSTFFANSNQYNSFRNFVSTLDADYIFMPYLYSFNIGSNWKYTYNGSTVSCSDKEVIIIYCDKHLDFYGSAHHNNFVAVNDLFPSYEWTSKKINDVSDTTTFSKSFWNIAFIRSDGTVVNNPSTVLFRTSGPENFRYYRNAYLTENQGNTSVFNTTDRTINIYQFDSLTGIQLFDSGQPSPYYVSENYKGSSYSYSSNSVNSVSSIYNNAQTYTEITENITTGMSVEELNTLIQTIINTNNDKPLPPSDDGGGGSGSDDKESLWDKIKDTVGDFFETIAEVIKGLVELVVETVVTVLTDLIKGFNKILTTMVDFLLGEKDDMGVRHNSFTDLMSGFFDWLPEPLPLMIKSIFTLACVFALIRMIKGLAS